jgi:hypothetical protein
MPKKTKLRIQTENNLKLAAYRKKLKSDFIQRIEKSAPANAPDPQKTRKLYAYKLLADFKRAHRQPLNPAELETIKILSALADRYYRQHKRDQAWQNLKKELKELI